MVLSRHFLGGSPLALEGEVVQLQNTNTLARHSDNGANNMNKINKKTEEKLKQRVELLLSFFNERGRMPSYSEMMLLFSLKSKNAVFKIVNKLQKEGFVIKDDTGHIIFNSDSQSFLSSFSVHRHLRDSVYRHADVSVSDLYSVSAANPVSDPDSDSAFALVSASDSDSAFALVSAHDSTYTHVSASAPFHFHSSRQISDFSVKLLGRIEAGFPSPAEEELLDMISIDKLLIKNPVSSFLLKVTGDSMTGAGIMQGDYVVVDKAMTAAEGDIVIAQVDNAWTMKYLAKENGSYILLPANPIYKPIKPKNELVIAGVVTGVARRYK
jgi:repressor LexA